LWELFGQLFNLIVPNNFFAPDAGSPSKKTSTFIKEVMDFEFVYQRHLRLRGYVPVEDLKETILEEAARLVNGPRRAEYGHPKENFEDVAKIWRVILRDERITAENVVQCMIALKLCRAKQGYHRDSYVDISGYSRCAEMLNEE
jgi:hypothetical protein